MPSSKRWPRLGSGCNIHPATAARDLRCIRSCPLSSTRNWFRLPFMYRPRAERRESSSLVGLHRDGSSPRHSPIANLSNSGAYVLTSEKWNPGEIVSLTLQRKGALEESSRLRFTVQVANMSPMKAASVSRSSCRGAPTSVSGKAASGPTFRRQSLKTSCVNSEPPQPSHLFIAYPPKQPNAQLGFFAGASAAIGSTAL